jgi:hypothetical protein
VPGSAAKIAEENVMLTGELRRIRAAIAGGGYAGAIFQTPSAQEPIVQELQLQLQAEKRKNEQQQELLLQEQAHRQRAEQQVSMRYEHQQEYGILGSPLGSPSRDDECWGSPSFNL